MLISTFETLFFQQNPCFLTDSPTQSLGLYAIPQRMRLLWNITDITVFLPLKHFLISLMIETGESFIKMVTLSPISTQNIQSLDKCVSAVEYYS